MALRWGIIGVGNISHDFVVSVKSSPNSVHHKFVAIASRNIERSKKFADSHGIKKSYGSYEDLAKDSEVEIVYVTCLNPFHYDACLIMLKNKKHVLCEKPFCINSVQTKSLLDIAKEQNVFIMEGLWSRFFPAYQYIKKLQESGNFGEVQEICIKHGFKGENVDRIAKKEMGGGIVLDIGVYAIQFVLFCFRDKPTYVKATGKKNSEGVDLYFEAEIGFSRGGIAKITCSGLGEFDNEAVVVTSKGTLRVPKYWCPTSVVKFNGATQSWPLIECQNELNFTNSEGLHYEADEVMKCVRSGQLSCADATPEDTLAISRIEDEIRKQIGVSYDCDEF